MCWNNPVRIGWVEAARLENISFINSFIHTLLNLIMIHGSDINLAAFGKLNL